MKAKTLRLCEVCNKEFQTYPYMIKKGAGRYCSKHCRMLSDTNPARDSEARLKMKQAKLDNPTNYWLGKKRDMPWLVPKKGAPAPMKGRPNLKIQGSKHWNWKGGITPRSMMSLEYKEWRKAVFERDNYTCQMCFNKGVYIEADHIKPWAIAPALRFNVDNGRTLCKPCHKIVTRAFMKGNTYAKARVLDYSK